MFGHIGDGNLHVNVTGVASGSHWLDDAVDRLVVEMGGSISAEHGIGTAKALYLPLDRSASEIAVDVLDQGGSRPGRDHEPGRVVHRHRRPASDSGSDVAVTIAKELLGSDPELIGRDRPSQSVPTMYPVGRADQQVDGDRRRHVAVQLALRDPGAVGGDDAVVVRGGDGLGSRRLPRGGRLPRPSPKTLDNVGSEATMRMCAVSMASNRSWSGPRRSDGLLGGGIEEVEEADEQRDQEDRASAESSSRLPARVTPSALDT